MLVISDGQVDRLLPVADAIDFVRSAFAAFSRGDVVCPQRLSLPFSLILDEPLDTAETRGLNRVIPGWVLKENVYLLMRNEAKYMARNQARLLPYSVEHHQAPDVPIS